jgi:hypothetical protein
MSTPHLSDAKKRRTKQTLQAPRHVRESKSKNEKLLSLDKMMKKLVWVTVGKTEHQAWLLEDLGEKESAWIEWESTRGKELVSVLNIRLKMPSRKSRQRNAQITDMKKLLRPPTPKELQDAAEANKLLSSPIKSAPIARKAKNESKSSGESKKKKRRQRAGAPKSYADPSEREFEFNKEASSGESSDEEEEFDLDVNDLGILPRIESSSRSSEGRVTRKRPRLSIREQLSDEDDSDLSDSDIEGPANSDDDEDPEIIKKSKYIKRISLTSRPQGGYYAEIMDSYHFPKFRSTTLPKPQLGSAAPPVQAVSAPVDSSDDEAEMHRTIERVSKQNSSHYSETSNKNAVRGVASNDSGKGMGAQADIEVEIQVDSPANKLSGGSEAIKTAGVPASAKYVEKKGQESIAEVSNVSVSSLPSLVSDMQTLPIAKTKIPSNGAKSNSAVAASANEMVVSKRLVDPPAANYSLGSGEEARTAESRPAKAATSKKLAEGRLKNVVPESPVPENLFVSGVAKKPTTSTKVRQKSSELANTESDGFDSSDDEDAHIKRANAWMELAKKNDAFSHVQSDISKAAAREQGVKRPPGAHKTATNGTQNQETEIQEAAGKRVSASTVGTASDDNTDMPKKSVLLRPTTGQLRANDMNSSDDEMAIERHKSQSSVVKKVAVPSTVAKAVATTDDTDSSDDEAELRRTRKENVTRPPGPHKTATNGTQNQETEMQEGAGKRVSASNVGTAGDDNTGVPKKSVLLRPTTGQIANDMNSSDDEMEIERHKSQSSVVKKVAVPSSVAKAVATLDDTDSSDDEAELRRARSTGPSASSNTLSLTDKKGASCPESRTSSAKPTGMPNSYDGNSSDDEAEIRRMKERMVAPPSSPRTQLPVGAGDSSDDEAEIRRTKRRRKSYPNRRKSAGQKRRRKMPQAAKRRASSFTIDAEGPCRKTPASNCIGFTRAGAQSLKRVLVKDFADRVAIWAVESSRETMKVAGSATIQESPDISFLSLWRSPP